MNWFRAVAVIILSIGIAIVASMVIVPGFFIAGLYIFSVYFAVCIASYYLWALIEISRSDRPSRWKTKWTRILILSPLFGIILYSWTNGREKREEANEERIAKSISSTKRKRIS